jgi:hypothetical protein
VSENEQFFIAEAISHARDLSFTECLRFMRGFTASISESHPSAPLLKSALAQLSATDAQLELLQVGETQMEFNGIGGTRS